MNQVIERLLRAQPVEIQAVALLHRLVAEGLPPDAGRVLVLGPEVEAALEQVEEISSRGQRIVQRCLRLQPIPLPTPPPGF